MLAAYEPKIHSLSKCVPSVLVSGGVVLGSEHASASTFSLVHFGAFSFLSYICFCPSLGRLRSQQHLLLVLSPRALCLGVLCVLGGPLPHRLKTRARSRVSRSLLHVASPLLTAVEFSTANLALFYDTR